METTREYAYRFRLLWLATVAGSVAKLALPVYAARETGSPLVVSAVVLGFTAPRLVLGLPFFIGFGANALGTLAGGAVAALWGTDAVFLGAGTLTLLMLVPFQCTVSAQAVATAGSPTGEPMSSVS
jgi:hypothetical protein